MKIGRAAASGDVPTAEDHALLRREYRDAISLTVISAPQIASIDCRRDRGRVLLVLMAQKAYLQITQITQFKHKQAEKDIGINAFGNEVLNS